MLGLLERPDTREELATGGGRATHIVKQTPGKTAQALVTEARVFGLELEALCGHRWTPQHNPADYPVCQGCLDVYHGEVPPGSELPEA